MRVRLWWILLAGVFVSVGCGKKKSTDEMIRDLKAPAEQERVGAVRTLSQQKGDVDPIVLALSEALKDKSADVRWNSAIGLGSFGEKARAAIPALQEARHDRDPRVREAANIALSRIDPNLPPESTTSSKS